MEKMVLYLKPKEYIFPSLFFSIMNTSLKAAFQSEYFIAWVIHKLYIQNQHHELDLSAYYNNS